MNFWTPLTDFTIAGKLFTKAGKLFTYTGKLFTTAGNYFTNEDKRFTIAGKQFYQWGKTLYYCGKLLPMRNWWPQLNFFSTTCQQQWIRTPFVGLTMMSDPIHPTPNGKFMIIAFISCIFKRVPYSSQILVGFVTSSFSKSQSILGSTLGRDYLLIHIHEQRAKNH